MQENKNNIKNLLQIKNSTETSCDLYFYGDIVDSWWGAWDDMDQYPESIKNFLDEAKGKDINIYINSGGGSVFAGMAIYNMLKRHQGYKTVYVDGLVGSIASVIALAGDKVIIPSNAYMMIHKPWSGLYGNSTELREMADTLDKIEEGILNVYNENLAENADFEVVKAMVNAETWLTGDEASKYFNINVGESVDAVACASDYFN
ncbi:MAG: Clp protease ClpP, partial [Peptostreptococcaceae bacterium]|nr:Clp protease ClpP [Peptostreptococcaceae bacterium]